MKEYSTLSELKEYDDETYEELVNSVNKHAAHGERLTKLYGAVIGLCFLIVICIAVIMYFRAEEMVEVADRVAPPSTKFKNLVEKSKYKFTVNELVAKYKLRPSVYSQDIQNKIVTIVGTVQYSVVMNGEPLVVLNTFDPKYYVFCYLQDHTASEVINVKKGQVVLVVGKLTDNFISIGKVNDLHLMGSSDKQILTIKLNNALMKVKEEEPIEKTIEEKNTDEEKDQS